MSRSRGRLVVIGEPAVKSTCVPDTFVPRPTYRPVGRWSPEDVSTPGCAFSMYSRSWKFARLVLNPAVLTFARLLAITSIDVFSAVRADAADWRETMAIVGSRA